MGGPYRGETRAARIRGNQKTGPVEYSGRTIEGHQRGWCAGIRFPEAGTMADFSWGFACSRTILGSKWKRLGRNGDFTIQQSENTFFDGTHRGRMLVQVALNFTGKVTGYQFLKSVFLKDHSKDRQPGERFAGLCLQRKERSQEEAGFLLALEGSGGTGVPMLGGWGPSPRAGGSKISLFRCSRGFAGITSSHPCYSSLEPLSLCPKTKARSVPKGETLAQKAAPQQKTRT